MGVLFVLVAIAVATFILSGMRMRRYAHLDGGSFDLEYGVEDCAAFPFMSELRELAAQDTREKLARG